MELLTRRSTKNICRDTHVSRPPWGFYPVPRHLAQNEANDLDAGSTYVSTLPTMMRTGAHSARIQNLPRLL